MQDFFTRITTGVGISDVVDVLIVAFVVYKILGFIRESRAEQLVKGLIFLVAATFLSGVFNLYTINWILKETMAIGIIALVIVFQPELRRGLEYMGRSKLIKDPLGSLSEDTSKKLISEMVSSIEYFSANKIGALIAIEKQTSLEDVADSGTKLDAEVTDNLIRNVFYEGSPLHDGAVIIRGKKLYAAGCVLPLTQKTTLPSELGTRHRAGIGLTEASDALVIIVSEETGVISVARDGKLGRFMGIKNIEKILLETYRPSDPGVVGKLKNKIKKRQKSKGGKNV